MTENILNINKNCWIITNLELNKNINSQWFDDKYWLNQGRLLGASSGRGSAWMVKSDHKKMMLRHYYRGGIPAKFIKDKYLWTGLNKTRGFSEYRLLAKMIDLDLPVPRPIAAQVCKVGFFYQANILIEYINHTSTFATLLNSDSALTTWKNIGKTIAEFHYHGIYHADLNAHNILIDDDIVYLIDFDHSKQCAPRKRWKSANLNRLKRSINKITDPSLSDANEKKWQHLIASYHKQLNSL
jgi:3-deoxy-D-manno-octulosonic acid kinase